MTELIVPIPSRAPVRETVMVTSLRQQLRRGATPSVLYRIAGGEAAFWRLVSAYSLSAGLDARAKANLASMRRKGVHLVPEGVPDDVAFRQCPQAPAVECPAAAPPAPDVVAMPASAKRLTGAAAASKAKAAVHSTDLGVKPRVIWVDLARLVIDKSYQREIGHAGIAHVNRLLREFNWNCCQPLIVSELGDGRFAVIDGQHRLEAARKHPLIDELPCDVVEAPDVAAQAAIFAASNSRRLALTSQQKFWAAHAGGDAGAVEVERLCSMAGVTILRTMPSSDIPPRSIRAPFTLQKMVRQVGVTALGLALELLVEAHGEKPNAFRSPTVVALARMAAVKGFAPRPALLALRGLDLDALYDDARRDRVTGGGSLEAATERVLRKRLDAAGAA